VKPKNEEPKKVVVEEESTGSEETGSTTGSESSSETGSTVSTASSSEASGTKERAVKQEIAGGRGRGGRAFEPDKELDSLTIEMRSGKRLFVDAKENHRGKFIRMAEAFGRTNGRNYGNRQGGRIIMRLKVAKEMAERLDEFTDAAEEIMEKTEKREESKSEAAETNPVRGRVRPIRSAVILDEGRRYFIDLLPSRFKDREPVLRFTMNNTISGLRNFITVESGEAPYVKKALSTLVEKFYDEHEEQEDKAEMELSRHSVRFGRRTFFFDPGRQARGMFVRVTEVCMRDGRAMRSSVMLPDKVLAQCAQILSDYNGTMNTGGKNADDASSTGSGEGVKDGANDKKEGLKAT